MYSERARVGHNLLQQLLLNNNEHHKHFPFPLKGINVIQRLCFCVNVSQGPLVTHEDTKVTALFAKLAKLIFLCCNRRQSDICSCLFPLSAVAEVPYSPTLALVAAHPRPTLAANLKIFRTLTTQYKEKLSGSNETSLQICKILCYSLF